MASIERIRAFGHDKFRVRIPHEHRNLLVAYLDEHRYSHLTRSTHEGVDFYFAHRDELSDILAGCFDGIELDWDIERLDSSKELR